MCAAPQPVRVPARPAISGVPERQMRDACRDLSPHDLQHERCATSLLNTAMGILGAVDRWTRNESTLISVHRAAEATFFAEGFRPSSRDHR
jgi:hypothetical protein